MPCAEAGVIQDLAKAFLTLGQAFSFYPAGHQARSGPLARLVEAMRAAAAGGGCTLGFAGEEVLWGGTLYADPPSVVSRLARELGGQGVASIGWTTEVTASEVERFFAALAAARAAGRRRGWGAEAEFGALRVEGPDYRSLMDEGGGADDPERRRELWRALLARSHALPGAPPSDEERELLRGAGRDAAVVASLLLETIGPGAETGGADAVEAVRRFAGLLAGAAAPAASPDGAAGESALAAVARRLPAQLQLGLHAAALEDDAGPLLKELGGLERDEAIALVARAFAQQPGQIERLTRVFQHLVPRPLERMELMPQLKEEVRRAEAPDDPLADNAWEEIQELLTGESGEFMSPGYQEQLRRFAARDEARRAGEMAFAGLPGAEADLAGAQTAVEAQRIQFELLRLATTLERYRDALEGLAGLCVSTLTAGDFARGVGVLRHLLEIEAAGEPLAGPAVEIERSVRSIARREVLQALIPALGGLAAADRDVVRALFRRAPDSVPELLDALVGEEDPGRRREVAALVGAVGEAVVPEVLRRLPGADPAQVRLLLPLIAGTANPAAAPVLLGLLGGRDPKVRREALRALLRLDTPEVRRSLRPLLEDPDEEIVQLAAAHLGAVGSPETVREMLQILAGGFFAGRHAGQAQRAVFVLGRMGAAEAVAPLAEVLRRRPWIGRRAQEHLGEAAAQALARIGGDEAKRALEQAAARGPEGLAQLCRRLLARWGRG